MYIEMLNDFPLIINQIFNSNNKVWKTNKLYVLREDLIPYSFGGNKVRKAVNFFKDIQLGQYNTVITYGSPSSNHARVIANFSSMYKLKCIIVTPSSSDSESINTFLVRFLGAQIVYCKLSDVKSTIEKVINDEIQVGRKPYFIEGGGHGNLGTSAYVEVYEKILKKEKELNIIFDYIFLASGTGTTQAGLIIGNQLNNNKKNIIGISIARSKEKGTEVIAKSIKDYYEYINTKMNTQNISITLDDSYIVDGYGTCNDSIKKVLKEQLLNNGLPLDTVYTAKAFWGMENYLNKNGILSKNILFIHTGGTPLFFDNINNMVNE